MMMMYRVGYKLHGYGYGAMGTGTSIYTRKNFAISSACCLGIIIVELNIQFWDWLASDLTWPTTGLLVGLTRAMLQKKEYRNCLHWQEFSRGPIHNFGNAEQIWTCVQRCRTCSNRLTQYLTCIVDANHVNDLLLLRCHYRHTHAKHSNMIVINLWSIELDYEHWLTTHGIFTTG